MTTLFLDLAPLLPPSLVGYPIPTPIDHTQVSATSVAGGSSMQTIMNNIFSAFATQSKISTLSTSIGPQAYFAVPCSIASGDGTLQCDTNPSICMGTVPTPNNMAPTYINYLYSSPLNLSALLGKNTIADIINNPFGTIYTMNPVVGISVGTVNSQGYPASTTSIGSPFEVNPGDLKSDGNLYFNVTFTGTQNNATACGFTVTPLGGYDLNYTVQVHVYLYLTTTTSFMTRCCANVGITNEIGDLLCPAEYSGIGTTNCDRLLNVYCTDSETLSDPICGCYPEYVETQIIDKDPKLKSWLNGVQLPSGCATSCNPGTAYYVKNLVQPCNLTICAIDVENEGAIDTEHMEFQQNCNIPSPTPGPEPGPGPSPTPQPSNETTLIIVGSVVAGVILLAILLLFLIV